MAPKTKWLKIAGRGLCASKARNFLGGVAVRPSNRADDEQHIGADVVSSHARRARETQGQADFWGI